MPRFSIIVPVFNSANTLRRCIDSVFNQTYSDWELILVDDGSKDLGIIFDYDPRIKFFRQEHRGVSSSRNKGIQEASGDYLLFLDADDYIGSGYLKVFADGLSNDSSDICLSGLTRIERNGESRPLVFPFSGLVSKETVLPSFYTIQRTNQLYGYVAGKAVRRSFLMKHSLLFNEKIHKSEDLDFFLRCYEQCSFFLFVQNTDYHYVKHKEKTRQAYLEVDYFSLISIHRHLQNFCCGHMDEDDMSSYRKTIAAWVDSAILDTRIVHLRSLPGKLQRISLDPELQSLCHVNGPISRLALKVFMRQVRLFFIRVLLIICPQ